MTKQHEYTAAVEWTGNQGTGTSSTRPTRELGTSQCPRQNSVVHCSKDPLLGGPDPNSNEPPEDLLALLASPHATCCGNLHLASDKRVAVQVQNNRDSPSGVGEVRPSGARSVRFAVLPGRSRRSEGQRISALAEDLHHRIHEFCFIAPARGKIFPR